MTNSLLAIGVWNYQPISSDLVLVPKLQSNPGVEVIRGPYLQLATPDSIVVRWRTSLPLDSVVRYGLSPGDLSSMVMDTAIANDHEHLLSGLIPDTKYFYSIAVR